MPAALNKLIAFTVLVVVWASSQGQDLPEAYYNYLEKFPAGLPLNRYDSMYLASIPEKELPDVASRVTLPPVVDNSSLPFLRPVFGQEGPSCGQAAMVGYNFTYEINCLRGLPADEPQNQYPTHFTFNFNNGGNGWWGVSYFHSLEILEKCGNMNVVEYGGLFDDGMRWIDGYSNYYSGMHNRIRGFYSIHTGTEDGILALKHWLYNHMGEQTYGGVASYYANVPWNAHILNDTTPEGGKHVMTNWYPEATHAMTIVGYNDSIRWDYNGDGLYTNHIDLNDDGIMDPRDWEIGAVKFVNSHGLESQDSGFCYMMYKCLAETFENGGVWNQAVHIVDARPSYDPLATLKITIRHDYREKIKVMAGISTDTTDLVPDFIMDFPIVNYQGGSHYMQGNDTAEYLKTLEYGLDITPLLSHVEPGAPARFFLVVDEYDPYNEGTGEIISFSLIDYTSGAEEFPAPGLPVTLSQNSQTLASLVCTPDFDKVMINEQEIPPFIPGQEYAFQLTASGGTAPYSWAFGHQYLISQASDDFPLVDENRILPDPMGDTLVAVPLGFDFPFFGTTFDTVYLHVDGHLQFETHQSPWPYIIGEYDLHLKNNRMIAPMTHNDFSLLLTDNDGAWYQADSSSITFRWKLSVSPKMSTTEANFAVKLLANGDIEFFHGPSSIGQPPWISGISSGNRQDYYYSPLSGSFPPVSGTKVRFSPCRFPAGLEISPEGVVSGTVDNDSVIFNLPVRVTDDFDISTKKIIQLSSGPLINIYAEGAESGTVLYGDTVTLDLEIRNNGPDTLWNPVIGLTCGDEFVSLLDDEHTSGLLAPGEMVNIPAAFTIGVSLTIPDQHLILLEATLQSQGNSWTREVILKADAPLLQVESMQFDDGDDGILDPGETASLLLTLRNSGHSPVEGVSGQLYSPHPEVQVVGNPLQDFGDIGKGMSATATYTLYAEENTPCGFPAGLLLNTTSENGLQATDTLKIRIGRIPALVIDMDPGAHSGPVIYSMMQQMDIITDYDVQIPGNIDQYQTLFVCLGYQNFNHVLSWYEGEVLANYVDNGGYLYMEGRKTWKDDPWTPVHDRFYLTHAGGATVFDTLVGNDTSFTQGITLFNGASVPFSFYYLEPISTAFSILHDNDNFKSCAVANQTSVYKTIGSLFELGTMEDIPPSTREQLMQRYLDFFGIYYTVTGMEEPESGEKAKPGSLEIWPNPAGKVVHCRLSIVDVRSEVEVRIFDMYGREVMKSGDVISLPAKIDVSALPAGMYVIVARDESALIGAGKVVISR